jgi:GNAT superfamily N-acetyltransferase
MSDQVVCWGAVFTANLMIVSLVPVSVTIEETAPDDPRLIPLLTALRAELDSLYPEERSFPSPQVRQGAAYLLATVGGEVAGCCALQPLDDGWSEVKRMYVAPDHRGQGIAGVLMAAVERLAAERGYERIKLETGVRQPAAIAVYQRAGFTPIPVYAPYDQWNVSVCMAKPVA